MMTFKPLMVTRLLTVTGLLLVFNCNLDIAKISFNLPPQMFDLNTSSWNLPAATLPSISCTDTGSCCAQAMVLGIDCTLVTCDAPSGTCAFTVTFETPPQTVNLKEQVPALKSLNSQSVGDVTISKITYDISSNSMNVPLPPVDLYLADNGAMSTADASATKFGTVPSTPAMTTLTGGQVMLDSAGQQAFINYAHNFGTPFEFIAKVTVVVPGGTPLPAGDVQVSVTGQISVTPNL